MFFKHKIFALFFNLFTKFPINTNRVSFIIDSNNSFSSNLTYIHDELEKRQDFDFNYFYKDKFSISSLFNLATSKYVFLNDNFFPLAFMNFKDNSIVIQLWHAPGAFKKFGASVENSDMLKKISDNTDYLIITSDHVKKFYEEAFQIDESKIQSLGLPRSDYYFKNHNLAGLKEKFHDKYNIGKDKKIILYAPTFRQDKEYNDVFKYLDLEEFNNNLADEYILVLRLHPKVKKFYDEDISSTGKYVDCSDYENEQELLLISDILITDYSSIMIEFAILDKPVIFFAYDLDNYLNNERGFYLDYEHDLPGPVVYNSQQLINCINNGVDTSKLKSFVELQFGNVDGSSSKKIIDFVINEGDDNG